MKAQVFINGRFLAQRVTGVQRYGHEMLLATDALVARGAAPPNLRFTVLAPPNADAPPLRAIGFESVGRLTGNPWEQLELPLYARSGWLIGFSPTGPLVKKDQIVTMHDAAILAVPHAFSWKFRTWYRIALPTLLRRTPAVMTISEFARSELVARLGAAPSRVCVTGGGCEHVNRVTPDASVLARHGLTPQRYVLAVSSITPHKNFAVIGRALRHLEHPDFDVVVAGAVNNRVFGAGDGPVPHTLKHVGYVDDRQLCALYENAGAFVFPSLYEGLGLPPLEAMALGCPVLASTAPAVREICEDAPLYFSPHDARHLAELMERVMKNPVERAELVRRGRSQVAKHGWERAARRQLAFIAEVVGGAPAKPRAEASLPSAAAP